MLALRADRLFDGLSSVALGNPTVVIDEGRILSVSSGGAVPADAEELVMPGATLLPGLIDTHVHLGFDASQDPVSPFLAAGPADLLATMRENAARALSAGITTVRDLGGKGLSTLDLRDAAGNGGVRLPHMLVAGPPITSPDGHCHFMGGVADGEGKIRTAVRALIERGVDVIKMMGTGGSMTPGSDPLHVQFQDREIRAAVEEAHAHGVPVTVHAHARDGIRAAVRAGADGLEHAKFWVADGIEPDPATIDDIARRGVWVCPTMGAVPGSPPPPAAVAKRLALADDLMRDMHRRGVRLVAGTDAGISPAKPHDVLSFGIEEMARAAAMSNAEALRSATSVAADCCGVPAKGRLIAGADADIIAVGGDPLTELGALRAVRAVILNGARVR
ncbi:metal-dependent hydrolase family protein [Symbioplanes lichenis]|uniref:metal-dependent hydrolase family protein n=1 Tax=Symbioplanes lichenis TaxID=1629072 RepID=UPI00273A1A76|nr:amidohydrolase family protein [Actinoplanes lichenis]